MEESSSIYMEILKAREESPSLPYSFQDVRLAGRDDVLFLLLTEGIPFSQKEDLARQCSTIILELLEGEEEYVEDPVLLDFLKKKPMRLFFLELQERLRVLLEHGVMDEKKLHTFAVDIVKNSRYPEEVKLGLVLLGFYPNDLTQQVMKTFGYHSEYSIYVIESMRHPSFKQNPFIFDLAQNTEGFGRLASIFFLKPILKQQQEWLLKKGIKSDFLSNAYANLAFQKTDFRAYLFNLELTAENYRDCLYLLAYRDEERSAMLPQVMLDFMERVVEHREFAETFIDVAGLIMLWHQTIDSWKDDYQHLDESQENYDSNKVFWDDRFSRFEKMIRNIEMFLNKPRWRQIVLQEMTDPVESDYLIITTLKFLSMTPEFEAFTALLARTPLGLNLLDFFLANHAEEYFEDVCNYLDSILNEELFKMPLQQEADGEAEALDDLMRVNIWLENLFECMSKKEFYHEEWCLRGIRYYHPEIRQLALEALQKHRKQWGDSVRKALRDVQQMEMNANNMNLVKVLLDPEAPTGKERRYLPVNVPITQAVPTDRKLLDTYISGTYYRDLTGMEGSVKKGSILQLVRERDNERDTHSIAVTLANGYMVGHIPRVDNRVLANLLDTDAALYALLEEDGLDERDPAISVYLQKTDTAAVPAKKPDKNKNIVPFPQKSSE